MSTSPDAAATGAPSLAPRAAAAGPSASARHGELRIVVDNDPFANVLRWLVVALLSVAIGLGLGYLFWGRDAGPLPATSALPIDPSSPRLVESPAAPSTARAADAGPRTGKRRASSRR